MNEEDGSRLMIKKGCSCMDGDGVGSYNGNNKDINKSSRWGRNSTEKKEKEKESEATVVRPHRTYHRHRT